jgi:hypothetical protein
LVVVVGNPYENLDPAAAVLEKAGHHAEAVEFLDQLVKSAPWEASYRLRLARARLAAKDANASVDPLAKIASSAETAYSVRVEAAIALSLARTTAKLGSAELKLLSAGPHTISATAADQAFFYDARLKAAENATDVRTKLQPLRAALADTPARSDARIALFKAAESIHSDELALLSIEPLLRDLLLQSASRNERNEEEIVSSGDTDTDAGDEETPTQVYAATKLSPAEQEQISMAVAHALVRLRRWNEALPYLQLAQKLEKAPARRKEITGKLAEVRTVLRREHLNLARQPILHQELEQDRVVRPRLVTRAPTLAKTSATGGQ